MSKEKKSFILFMIELLLLCIAYFLRNIFLKYLTPLNFWSLVSIFIVPLIATVGLTLSLVNRLRFLTMAHILMIFNYLWLRWFIN